MKEVREINRKIVVIGAFVILSVLFLMPSAAFANKMDVAFAGTNITFENIVIIPLGDKALHHFDITGEMTGDIEGSFVWIEDRIWTLNDDGTMDSAKVEVTCEVTTAAGTVVIAIKHKLLTEDGPFMSKSGRWMLIGGTGLMSTLSGSGTFIFPFQFEGKIK
jgi:hypothetical protein